MKLIPVLVEGFLKEPLSYNFGSLYPITQGDWELCLNTIALFYTKSKNPPDPPNINRFIRTTCNCVQNLAFEHSQTQSSLCESVLALHRLKLKAGQKEIFNFSENIFFLCRNLRRNFKLT